MHMPIASTQRRALRVARPVLPLSLLLPLLAWGAPQSNAQWATVANNGNLMPSSTCAPSAPTPDCRTFNSFNQPSVNRAGLVVFRARSRGGSGQGEPLQGIYRRNMAAVGAIVRVLDRTTVVPQPNNRGTTFRETPAFPRIDATSSTVATRGNHPPVWQVVDDAGEVVEQVGTNGIYANPFGPVVTGESRLGSVPAFSFFQVPEQPGTAFDIIPGAPSVTRRDTIVFKGNYTVGTTSKTGVYYRRLTNTPFPIADGAPLSPGSGTLPVVLIANSDSYIPGTAMHFGSTAPPTAAGSRMVFLGVDNEDQPTAGGIYLAPLAQPLPALRALVRIGDHVPGEATAQRFRQLGEGLSFDGRFVAFWGAWGLETEPLVLTCPEDGNADLLAFCRQQYPDGHTVQVPVHQGMFVHDTVLRRTWAIAKSPTTFSTFLFWTFSGQVPGGATEEDGEPARWRSAAFVSVSGLASSPLFRAAFKARKGPLVGGSYVDLVDGIYLRPALVPALQTLAATGTPGTALDPKAVDPDTGVALPITSVGIEREGFRGSQLVINASMASEEAGWAGIYLTRVR